MSTKWTKKELTALKELLENPSEELRQIIRRTTDALRKKAKQKGWPWNPKINLLGEVALDYPWLKPITGFTMGVVDPDELIFAEHEPQGRVAIKSNYLKKLEADMRKRGQIFPIFITPDRRIITGHKRATIAKRMGIEVICCVLPEVYAPLAFWIEDYYHEPFGPPDKLESYIAEAESIDPKSRANYDSMVADLDLVTVKTIQSMGGHWSRYNEVRLICEYMYGPKEEQGQELYSGRIVKIMAWCGLTPKDSQFSRVRTIQREKLMTGKQLREYFEKGMKVPKLKIEKKHLLEKVA